MPIVYDPRVGSSLVGHLVGAITGSAITRGTSFLKDMLGQQVFDSGITIVDDPHRRRGLRSRAFDGEGLPTAVTKLIDAGRADRLAARFGQRAAAGVAADRPCGARHLRPAGRRHQQPAPRRRHRVRHRR